MNKFEDIRGVAFDLDGTLVDSAPGLAAAVDMALYALELPVAVTARIFAIFWLTLALVLMLVLMLPKLDSRQMTELLDSEHTQWDQVLDMLEAHSDSSIVPLSKSTPDVETPSLKPLWRELSRVVQHNLQTVLGYDLLAGQRVLRH